MLPLRDDGRPQGKCECGCARWMYKVSPGGRPMPVIQGHQNQWMARLTKEGKPKPKSSANAPVDPAYLLEGQEVGGVVGTLWYDTSSAPASTPKIKAKHMPKPKPAAVTVQPTSKEKLGVVAPAPAPKPIAPPVEIADAIAADATTPPLFQNKRGRTYGAIEIDRDPIAELQERAAALGLATSDDGVAMAEQAPAAPPDTLSGSTTNDEARVNPDVASATPGSRPRTSRIYDAVTTVQSAAGASAPAKAVVLSNGITVRTKADVEQAMKQTLAGEVHPAPKPAKPTRTRGARKSLAAEIEL